ncbi:MAG: DUF2141 domain-containing protein [Saprospiraceae bacterium]|nr:DUF2141 domain-containing protein [Saprospiraceae bacterium]
MKWVFLTIVPFIFALQFPKVDIGSNVTIRFSGVKKTGGTIRLALYSRRSDFMVEEKAALYNFKADKLGSIEGRIENLPAGEYAFAVFLDENNNKKLDKNLVGVPTEPYGFSKVPPSKWRLPTWEEVHFEVGKNDQIVLIQLKRWALL